MRGFLQAVRELKELEEHQLLNFGPIDSIPTVNHAMGKRSAYERVLKILPDAIESISATLQHD